MPSRAPTFQLSRRDTDAGAVDARREAMLEAALDCIVTMDADGRIVDFNAAAERTFGYAREEARGRPLSELIVPPEMRKRHEDGLRRHLEDGTTALLGRRLEMEAMRRDGSRIPAELTVTRSDIGGEPLFIGFLRDLSGLHAAQAALQEAEERFRRLVEQVPTVTYICDYDEAVSVRYMSPQIEALTGFAPHRWTDDPQFWASVVHPGDREWVVAEMARRTREEIPVDFEYRCVAADGTVLHVLDQETIVRGDDGGPLYSQGVLVDVTELRSAEARLRVSEAQMQTIVDHAPMVLFAIDADGVFTLSEGKALELIGLEPGEVVGRSVFDVYARMPQIAAAVRSALEGEHVSQLMEVGEVVFDVAFSPVLDRHEGGPAVIGVATDVTSRHRSEQELAHFAYHDRLTGLANRALLETRLERAVEHASEGRTTVALLNLDLDDFKTVNDSLGHAAGDELLCAIARRLEHRVAAAHLLTRHGGDEFMLLLEDLPGDGRAVSEAVAAELLEELRLPFRVGGAALQVGASVGISLYPADALDAADLLKHADAAMYQAKRAGRGRHALYRAADDTATRRLELTGRLRTALAEGQLELHFQPVVELASGQIAGAEALVRWNDPERGMVSPAEFIPLAEDTGLIEAVGEWVLDAACGQARAWREQGLAIEVGVNVSPLELVAPGFGHRVADRMRAHGLGPGTLVIEITESALSEPAVVAPALDRIAEMGVRIAIDDFGAGFSSLTRLRHLTVHILKLDRSFLAGVPEDSRGAALIAAMLRLARELGLYVVAEGIETPEQLSHLRSAEASHGQGFHLARPMPAAELTALLQSGSGLGGAPS
jgi:diguanylate cyclase (GGDEF)-like protein/PAS domain S-box-containing protein